MREVKKLYRKQNTKALHYRHNIPQGDYARDRNSKAMKSFKGAFLSMHGKKERGLDYTPLYKFLLSKVGQNWDEVYSEAVSRLDKKDPIFWMVDLHPHEEDKGIIRVGESTYYSKLTVDNDGILIRINPNITIDDLFVGCSCCTHTFNGEVYRKEYISGKESN